jgi:hypothetical protein
VRAKQAAKEHRETLAYLRQTSEVDVGDAEMAARFGRGGNSGGVSSSDSSHGGGGGSHEQAQKGSSNSAQVGAAIELFSKEVLNKDRKPDQSGARKRPKKAR